MKITLACPGCLRPISIEVKELDYWKQRALKAEAELAQYKKEVDSVSYLKDMFGMR